MNGAETLLKTLIDCGIDTCFANPGTSEMQLVSAIGNSDGVRPVLCLFEGVATGAADGYARMADKPAITLLHLGSGLANGMANLHNARRARSPVVNIVGDHATCHIGYDAPLTSDLPGLAAWASAWMKVAESPEHVSQLGAEAVQASMQAGGQIATIVVPADLAWRESTASAPPMRRATPAAPAPEVVAEIAAKLQNGKRTALFLSGTALREKGLEALGRVAASTDADLVCTTFPARLQRGAGRVPVQRLPYFAEQASELLARYQQLVLVGTSAPVSFFAYPGKDSWLTAEGCEILTLAEAVADTGVAVEVLADALPAGGDVAYTRRLSPEVESGKLTPRKIGRVINRHMPVDTVVSDEGATCGLAIYAESTAAEPHDWLTLTGGAIGQGLPLALGVALACPKRKVVALQADGSGMYTVQALWSMVREDVDVTVVLLNNRSYAILSIELQRVGAGSPNAKTLSMLDLSNPDLDFRQLAESMGMPASRVETVEEFETRFREAMDTPGPKLIEAIVESPVLSNPNDIR